MLVKEIDTQGVPVLMVVGAQFLGAALALHVQLVGLSAAGGGVHSLGFHCREFIRNSTITFIVGQHWYVLTGMFVFHEW